MASVVCALLGCAKPPAKDADSQDAIHAVDQVSATPLAEDLARQYEAMQELQCTTTVTMTTRYNDGIVETDQVEYRLSYLDRSRFRMELVSLDDRVIVLRNGKELKSAIVSPSTRDFEGQEVSLSLSDQFQFSELYRLTEVVDPSKPDTRVSALMGAPVGPDMTILSLLLGQGKLHEVLREARSISDLPTPLTENDNTPCWVFEAGEFANLYRIWTNAETGMIRRIEFPMSGNSLPAGVASIEMVADIDPVQQYVDGQASFESIVTSKERQQPVHHFVLPPPKVDTDFLGKSIGPLTFYSSRKSIHVQNSSQGIAVLCWIQNHPGSRFVVQQLESLRDRFPASDIRFIYLNVDAAEDSNWIEEWGITAYRDHDALGHRNLGIQEAPTTVVIGPANEMHYFEVGPGDKIADHVSLVLERVQSGHDVGAATLAAADEMRTAYERLLAVARSGLEPERLETPLPKRTTPERLELSLRWETTDLPEPGNMIVLPGKLPQLIVLNEWRKLAFVGVDGNVLRQLELDLPKNVGVSLLRGGKDTLDRPLFAVATKRGHQVFVFDYEAKLQQAYPAQAGPMQLSDATFGDLDGDGQSELLVSWRGEFGIQCVTPDGRVLWTNKVLPDVENVTSVTRQDSRTRRAAAIAGNQGIYLVDDTGRTLQDLRPSKRSIHRLVSWPGAARALDKFLTSYQRPTGKEASQSCGVAFAATGGLIAIGLSEDWRPVWEYRLPVGRYRHQIDFPQSMSIEGVGPCWVLPGADGSVHIVGADGRFRDSFHTGEHLRGVATINRHNAQLVITATDHRLTAYSVRFRGTRPQ